MAIGVKHILDYDDYAAIPSDGKRYGLLNGDLHVTPAPSPRHQWVSKKLQRQIEDHFEVRGIGRVFNAPTFLGWSDRNAAIGWWNEAWRPFVGASPLSFAAGDRSRWPAVLYAARQTLLDGGKVYILADGDGAEAFRLPLSVGDCPSGPDGWRFTDSPALPSYRSSIISRGVGTS